MNEIIARAYRVSPTLTKAGCLHALLALVALGLMPFDERLVMGVSPWLKPFKFMVSIALYLWTLAWMLSEFTRPGRSELVIARTVSVLMLIETGCLWLQAARGTMSHFNQASAFDGTIFGVMGISILANTLLAVWLFALLFRRPLRGPSPVVWGWRLGLTVFLAGSALGLPMIQRMAHTVGAPDGGPGLPLVNWSTQAGDLRIAHGLGLHGLQVFPLIGYLLASRGRPAAWLAAPLLAWTALIVFAFLGALQGHPLYAGS